MVVAGAPPVFGDVDTPYPQLTLVEITERIGQRSLARTDGLDLGTDEHDARNVLFQNLIVERRALVTDIYLFLFTHIFGIDTIIAYLFAGVGIGQGN